MVEHVVLELQWARKMWGEGAVAPGTRGMAATLLLLLLQARSLCFNMCFCKTCGIFHLFVQGLVQGSLGAQGCTFLCGDGLTCLPSDKVAPPSSNPHTSYQVCDDYYDCPGHQGGEGGEDEEVCGASTEEEEEGNTVERVAGVRQQVEDLCLASGGLVADQGDCHSFYHCDELMPQKQSCGDLMFNTLRQVNHRLILGSPECYCRPATGHGQ